MLPYGFPVLFAKSVDGISFENNTVTRSVRFEPYHKRKYTFTFENDQYLVTLVGGNNNISDRKNFNQVSLTTNNSAGKQVIQAGSGLTTEEHDKLMELLELGEFLGLK